MLKSGIALSAAACRILGGIDEELFSFELNGIM